MFAKDGKPPPDDAFNVRFELDSYGFDAMLILSNRDIAAGEELLVDYGNLYIMTEPGAEDDTGYHTGDGSECEDFV